MLNDATSNATQPPSLETPKSPLAVAHERRAHARLDRPPLSFLSSAVVSTGIALTEMVNAGAIVHGGTERHLRFNAEEHPVALQLGGSEREVLVRSARLGQAWGCDEINLNCGCPSERVQRGAFGACLMQEPSLVADCIKAMVDVVEVPVTVKHRIGIDKKTKTMALCATLWAL